MSLHRSLSVAAPVFLLLVMIQFVTCRADNPIARRKSVTDNINIQAVAERPFLDCSADATSLPPDRRISTGVWPDDVDWMPRKQPQANPSKPAIREGHLLADYDTVRPPDAGLTLEELRALVTDFDHAEDADRR